jgi:hypothetical protein
MSDFWNASVAWIPRAVPGDTANVKRWFVVDSQATIDGRTTRFLRRVLGWDESPPPAWVSDSTEGRVTVRVEERDRGDPLELVMSFVEKPQGGTIPTSEPRRVEVPVSDWSQLVATDMWSLRVPSIMYEMWPSTPLYEGACQQWKQLVESERQASGIQDQGRLGSTIVFLPQRRLYFAADSGLTSYLALPDPQDAWANLNVISEVLDGDICISRSVGPLRPEPWHEPEPAEGIHYLKIRHVTSSFAAMNALDLTAPPDAIAALPADAHGWSGSDWRISVVGSHACNTVKIGLIRGIGGGYFTREPWRDRLPAIGFSAPARAQYVPPSADAAAKGYETLIRAKAPLWVCDPYAEPGALAPLATVLPGGRLLTAQKQIRPDGITNAWARSQDLEVRVQSKLHDRFIIGSQHGFIIGTSLNGFGKKHSFLVELDAVMRATVRDVFDDLWNDSKPPSPPW